MFPLLAITLAACTGSSDDLETSADALVTREEREKNALSALAIDVTDPETGEQMTASLQVGEIEVRDYQDPSSGRRITDPHFVSGSSVFTIRIIADAESDEGISDAKAVRKLEKTACDLLGRTLDRGTGQRPRGSAGVYASASVILRVEDGKLVGTVAPRARGEEFLEFACNAE